jgi:hypothetical protein
MSRGAIGRYYSQTVAIHVHFFLNMIFYINNVFPFPVSSKINSSVTDRHRFDMDRHGFDNDPDQNLHFHSDPDLDSDQDRHQNNDNPHADPTPSFTQVRKLGNIFYLLSQLCQFEFTMFLLFSSVANVSIKVFGHHIEIIILKFS